jgi:hypothetical protein
MRVVGAEPSSGLFVLKRERTWNVSVAARRRDDHSRDKLYISLFSVAFTLEYRTTFRARIQSLGRQCRLATRTIAKPAAAAYEPESERSQRVMGHLMQIR